jgi:hypothetical protein
MHAQRLVAFTVAVTSLTSLTGCDANFWDPTRFPPLHELSQVHVTSDPGAGDFPLGRYGNVVVGYESLLPDSALIIPGSGSPNLFTSRFVVSGGSSSAFYVWRGFEDRATSDSTTTGLQPVFGDTALYDGCRDREFCGDGAAASIAAFDLFPNGIDGAGDDFSCIATPAGAVGLTGGLTDERMLFRCETNANRILPVNIEDGIDLGASSVGLRAVHSAGCAPRSHGVGLALFGAPRAHDQTGGLFVARAVPGISIDEIDLSALPLPANASLGAQIAAIALDADRALVAISARSEENLAAPVVVVMTLIGSPGGVSATVHACLSGSTAAFGRSLAVGDLTGDGSPEIAIGGGNRQDGSGSVEEAIAIYDFASLSSASLAGCGSGTAPPAARSVTCADVAGLTCADPSITERTTTGFGASLAIAELNGDAIGDLVVGAPHARIGNVPSGAVVSMRGASTLSGLGEGDGGSAAIAPSTARAGMLLGYSVSTMRGTDRSEIVAGAPGTTDALVFFCSGIAGDRPSDLTSEAEVSRGCVVSVMGGPPPRCTGGSDAGMADAGMADAGADDAGVPDDAGP